MSCNSFIHISIIFNGLKEFSNFIFFYITLTTFYRSQFVYLFLLNSKNAVFSSTNALCKTIKHCLFI